MPLARLMPYLGDFPKLNLWEVDFDTSSVIEVVGEDIESNVGNDFSDLCIVESSATHRIYVRLGSNSLFGDDLTCELQRCRGLLRRRLSIASRIELCFRETGQLSDIGMRGY